MSRCVFETYFTLDTEEDVKQRVLKSLIAVSSKAVPGQSLASLGGALVRKATETDDVGAAFFLSLVPPTVRRVTIDERERCFVFPRAYIVSPRSISSSFGEVRSTVNFNHSFLKTLLTPFVS